MNIFKLFMNYMRENQTPAIRRFHITILILVITQILLSNIMDFTDTGAISPDKLEFYGTWMHILFGLLIIPLAVIFILLAIRQRGFKYFYPYFSGKFNQLKSDLGQLKQLSLPESQPFGIPAIIQGLGFGALLLVLISGLTWFVSWSFDFSWSHDAKEVHEFFTGLIEAYVIGHGFMGLVHIFLNSRKSNKTL